MMKRIRAFLKEESGQGLLEYALLGVGIILLVIGVVKLLGGNIRDTFQRIIDEF